VIVESVTEAPSALDQSPQRVGGVGRAFIVGVAGHRDLHPDGIDYIRAAAATHLRRLREQLQGTEIRVLTGLAAGSDQLVAQVALDLGISVDALLPMPLQDYADDFDAQSLATLESLIRHPQVHCTELAPPTTTSDAAAPEELSDRDRLYFNLAQNLMRRCRLLIAVWDGQSPPLPAGTTDTVLRSRANRPEQTGWSFTDSTAPADPPERLVFWIPAARAGRGATFDARPACFLSGSGENRLERWREVPFRLG
jgi:hypothetical protein